MHTYQKHKHAKWILRLTIACLLPGCGGSGEPSAASMQNTSTSPDAEKSSTSSDVSLSMAIVNQPLREAKEKYSPSTQYSTAYCQDGNYPTQWEWNPATILPQPAPATSGTPKIVQMRNGAAIATYTSLGGDAGYSKPNSANGSDTNVGPFRRQPYLQWQPGDTFLIYPAVYSGANMQIYIGPNAANDADYSAGKFVVPENITIRGVTVNGQRPVIVNPPSGASNANYGQSLIYAEGRYSNGTLTQPASNITIENIDIVDSSNGGKIGKAAVYVNGVKNFILKNVRITGFKQHSANGIFGTGNNSGLLLLQNVELDSNGGSGGPEHNAYINASNSDANFTFWVRGSWSHDAYYGHELKSRAQRTVVEGSYLSGRRAGAGQQTEAYLLDVPDGGVLVARNNIFVKNYSGNNSNGASLTFGVESASTSRSWGLAVEHNTFVAFSHYYDDQNHPLYPMFIGSNAPGSKNVSSNLFVGYCPTGNAAKDFRGTNYGTLNFNEIDMGYRPRNPSLTGNPNIVGGKTYRHKTFTILRKTNALGARD